MVRVFLYMMGVRVHSHLLGPMQDRLDACGAAHCPAAVAAFAADGTPEAGFSLNTFISGP